MFQFIIASDRQGTPPVHAIKVYVALGGTTPLFLNIASWGMWSISLPPAGKGRCWSLNKFLGDSIAGQEDLETSQPLVTSDGLSMWISKKTVWLKVDTNLFTVLKKSTQSKSGSEDILKLPPKIIRNENYNLWIWCPNTGSRRVDNSTNRRKKKMQGTSNRGKETVLTSRRRRGRWWWWRETKFQIKYMYVCR